MDRHKETSLEYLPHVLLLVLLLVVGGALVWRNLHSPPPTAVSASSSPGGTELLLVFIGNSACGASSSPGFPESIRKLKEVLRRTANDHGYRFATMGIAVDPHVKAGTDFLANFGEFDEVVAGRGWLNSGATAYLHRDVPGPAVVPQVVVLVRDIDAHADDRLTITEDRLIVRKIGLSEITRWEHVGFPLPSDLPLRF